MRRPILYVIAIIAIGSCFTAGVHYLMHAASSDANGNSLPYRNETVDFGDMGAEQFIDPSPPPKFKAEREKALGIKSSP
jgi:hypothetical protein